MHHAYNEKQETMEGKDLSNQEKISMLTEKET